LLYPYIERWPPVYDAEDLADSIRDLVESGRLEQRFYRSQARLPQGVCQGDIIELVGGVPLIAEDGEPAVHDDVRYWMVTGNTCDIARSLETVPWSQLVPLVEVGSDRDLTPHELSDLRGYRYSRRFYLPPWSAEVKGLHHVADFLRPVAIHKTALNDVAEVRAGLEIYSWLLLHSCLVRFLARDDGRFS
jgi:hypothetical protein